MACPQPRAAAAHEGALFLLTVYIHPEEVFIFALCFISSSVNTANATPGREGVKEEQAQGFVSL